MKLLLTVILLLFPISVFAQTDVPEAVDPEAENLFFTDEVVKAAIVEFVPEEKQQEIVGFYEDIMNKNNGKMSIEKLFVVCRAAGFNTYRAEGYYQCRSFIEKLLLDSEKQLDDPLLTGFCPGLREDGTNPNNLKSITDKTAIGSFCSSTNIAAGEVIFNGQRKGREEYACTCLATACFPGYSFNNGVETVSGTCQTIIAQNGICLREEHKKSAQNDTTQKCLDFCATRYKGKGCSFVSVVNHNKDNKCICNPTDDERAFARGEMKKASDKKLEQKLKKASKVCKENSDSKYCIQQFEFLHTNIPMGVAVAYLYASKHGIANMKCSDKPDMNRGWLGRVGGGDDFIKCIAGDKEYEFRFGDLSEGYDDTRYVSDMQAICSIMTDKKTSAWANWGQTTKQVFASWGNSGKTSEIVDCDGASQSDCVKMNKALRDAGTPYKSEYKNKVCEMSPLISRDKDTARKQMEAANKILTEAQRAELQKLAALQPNFNDVKNTIEKYLKNVLFPEAKKIQCASTTINAMNTIDANFFRLAGDDFLICWVDDSHIIIELDDSSEQGKYERDRSNAAMACYGENGQYQGKSCHGFTEEQCINLNEILLQQGKQGAEYNTTNHTCVMADAVSKANKDVAQNVLIITGGVILAVATGGASVIVVSGAIADLALEGAQAINHNMDESQVVRRLADFKKDAAKCNDANCAYNAVKDNFARMNAVMWKTNANDKKQYESIIEKLAVMIGDKEQFEQATKESDLTLGDKFGERAESVITYSQIVIGVGSAGIEIAARAGKLGQFGQTMSKTVIKNPLGKTLTNKAVSVVNKVDNVDDAAPTVPSWTDELESIGVREVKGPNGSVRYQDIRNGSKFISADEVLKRIDDMPSSGVPVASTSDELASIGVREVKGPNGSVRYQDIRNGSKFISADDVLKRIDDMPSGATPSAPRISTPAPTPVVDDIVRSADDVVPPVSKPITPISSVKPIDYGVDIMQRTNRAPTLRSGSARGYDYYRIDITGMVRNQVDDLIKSLKNSGYDDVFVMKAGDDFVVSASNPAVRGGKAINNAGIKQYELAYISRTKGANLLDDTPTPKPADPVSSKPISDAPKSPFDISDIKNRASGNFDSYIAEAKLNKAAEGTGRLLPKSRLTNDEWITLNKSLEKDGVQIFETANGQMLVSSVSDMSNKSTFAEIFKRVNFSESAAEVNKQVIRQLNSYNFINQGKVQIVVNKVLSGYKKAMNSDPGLKRMIDLWKKGNLEEGWKPHVMQKISSAVRKEFGITNEFQLGAFKGEFSLGGSHLGHNADFSRKTIISINEQGFSSGSFKDMMNTLIHENVHGFQGYGKSSLSADISDISLKYYVPSNVDDLLYRGNPIEVEARLIGDLVSKLM